MENQVTIEDRDATRRMKYFLDMAKSMSLEQFGVVCPSPVLITIGGASEEGEEYLTRSATHIGMNRNLHFNRHFDPNARVFQVEKKEDLNPYSQMIVIGRSGNSDIQLISPGISKMHAYMTWATTPQGKKYQLADGNSRNGTWINEIKLFPHKPYEIESGKILRFGDAVYTVFYYPQDLYAAI